MSRRHGFHETVLMGFDRPVLVTIQHLKSTTDSFVKLVRQIFRLQCSVMNDGVIRIPIKRTGNNYRAPLSFLP